MLKTVNFIIKLMEQSWVPFTPVLADIFMGFYESKWLKEYNPNKAKLCLRYGYGILAAFHKEQDSLNFLSFKNKRHPNIKFTNEKQINTKQI